MLPLVVSIENTRDLDDAHFNHKHDHDHDHDDYDNDEMIMIKKMLIIMIAMIKYIYLARQINIFGMIY